jgi:hypothetical protein
MGLYSHSAGWEQGVAEAPAARLNILGRQRSFTLDCVVVLAMCDVVILVGAVGASDSPRPHGASGLRVVAAAIGLAA